MNILIIDHDEVASQLIKSKIEPLGHNIVVEHTKELALERLSSESFDIILVDPAPLTDIRSVVINIRRAVGNLPYVIVMSERISQEEALKSGANDAIVKPLDSDFLKEKIDNAARLNALIRRIGDDAEDFPSAGGVIAKSAFNQLFLSGIDRAGRYAERTYVMFIAISNYQEIRDLDGPYASDYIAARLSRHLVLKRRQSDIIGQTQKHEFALLLLRPGSHNEPVEAIKRFAESLEAAADFDEEQVTNAEITLTLIDLPAAAKLETYVVKPGKEARRVQA